MKNLAFLIGLLVLSIATPVLCADLDESNQHPIPVEKDVACSHPLDITQVKVPAEINLQTGYESEVANDCFTDVHAILTRITWWGGYIDGHPVDPEVTTFNIRVYNDVECRPGTLIAELLDQTPVRTYVGDDPNGYPTYVFELDTAVELAPGVFWVSMQGTNYRYPPKHGHAGDGTDKTLNRWCETMFRSDHDGYPEWTRVSEYLGYPWVASQEFELTSGPTPTGVWSWGNLKGLYR